MTIKEIKNKSEPYRVDANALDMNRTITISDDMSKLFEGVNLNQKLIVAPNGTVIIEVDTEKKIIKMFSGQILKEGWKIQHES
jgi:hypothetical protein